MANNFNAEEFCRLTGSALHPRVVPAPAIQPLILEPDSESEYAEDQLPPVPPVTAEIQEQAPEQPVAPPVEEDEKKRKRDEANRKRRESKRAKPAAAAKPAAVPVPPAADPARPRPHAATMEELEAYLAVLEEQIVFFSRQCEQLDAQIRNACR
jgi:hypothetical protein